MDITATVLLQLLVIMNRDVCKIRQSAFIPLRSRPRDDQAMIHFQTTAHAPQNAAQLYKLVCIILGAETIILSRGSGLHKNGQTPDVSCNEQIINKLRTADQGTVGFSRVEPLKLRNPTHCVIPNMCHITSLAVHPRSMIGWNRVFLSIFQIYTQVISTRTDLSRQQKSCTIGAY